MKSLEGLGTSRKINKLLSWFVYIKMAKKRGKGREEKPQKDDVYEAMETSRVHMRKLKSETRKIQWRIIIPFNQEKEIENSRTALNLMLL